MKRQKNQLMLGEIDQIRMPASEISKRPFSKFMAAAAGTVSAPHVQDFATTVPTSAPNPVLVFLMQRPEPKPLGPPIQTDKPPTREQRYAAAGFDQTICLRRNWFEMIRSLTMFRSTTKGIGMDIVEGIDSWPMSWDL